MNKAILHNTYFVMRHGKSRANEENIILSDPSEGTTDYGLVEEGKIQAQVSASKAKEEGLLDSQTIIVSSDFTRAKETAEIAREILQTDKILFTPKLRERHFGNWEKKHNRHYQQVWDEDIKDPHHKKHEVESTREVLMRTTALITELEKNFIGKKILLVSHGDALQILQTAFEEVDSGAHRSLAHLGTAEIRALN